MAQLHAEGAELVFISDINYIGTDDGGLYRAILLDLFKCEVVSWSIKPPRDHQRIGTDICRVMTLAVIAPVRVMLRTGLGPPSDPSRQSWPDMACDAQ
jgi:transposase InsO family protein